MGLLIKNIKCLVQTEDKPERKICGKDMARLGCIRDAFLFIQDGRISDFGSMNEYPAAYKISENNFDVIDASGKIVFPSFCDPHTHLVYAGSREQEFTDRIRGLTYEEIAERGGGILNSSKKLRESSEEDLYEQAMVRIREIISLGTGAVEI